MIPSNSSPRKNLWRNLKTQKTKSSGVDQINNSPSTTKMQQTKYNCQHSYAIQTRRPTLQLKNKQKNINFILNLQQTKLEQKINQNSLDQQIQVSKNNAQISQVPKIKAKTITQANKNTKIKNSSVGDESIVQEIVDFKNINNLDIEQYQQEQLMIMSLCSQSNPACKQIKFTKIKEELQKLQLIRQDIVRQIKYLKQHYSQQIQNTFNNLIAYILQFYYQKIQSNKLQYEKHLNNRLKISFANNLQFKDNQINNCGNNSMANQQKQRLQSKLCQYQQQINKLEQDIFKYKLENKNLQQIIQEINKDKQEMSQCLFDYQQKMAQFQLQVNNRVEEIVESKLKEQQKAIDQARSNKKFYLQQISNLQNQMQVLVQNQNEQILQQIQQRQEKLIQKQKQLNSKEYALNQLEVQLNSQKFDLQKKSKALQSKEVELRKLQAIIQKKKIQLNLKQKQIERQTSHRKKQSLIFQNKINRNKMSLSDDYSHSILNMPNRQNSGLKGTILRHNHITHQQQKKLDKSYNIAQYDSQSWKIAKPSQNIVVKKRVQYQSKLINNSSSSKQKPIYNKPYVGKNLKNQRPAAQASNTSSSDAHISLSKKQDKGRLDELGAKLQSLRKQIRKQIQQTQ